MAGIIKAEQVARGGSLPGQLFHFEDMARRADEYLARARRDAQQLVDRARLDAEDVRRQAFEQGRHAAVETAREAARQRVEECLQSLEPALLDAVRGIERSRQDWLNHGERCVVELAVAIARRVIRRELAQTPQITAALIRESLELAAGQGEVKLLLHPADYETLGDECRRLSAAFGRLADVQIAADPAVGQGGCRVETRFGVIDQQIESQLQRIRDELLS